MRQAMPIIFSFIQDLRAAFGADEINSIIQAGIAGVPGFWAREGGHEVGTRYVPRGTLISVAQMVIIVPKKEDGKAARTPRCRC